MPVFDPAILQVAVASWSMSTELNWPLTLSVVSSCTAPASWPVAKLSTGASLLPLMVTVNSWVSTPPRPSLTCTLNTSL
ncbi:hypothetical protein D3C86_2011420 [compost metagenome]